MEARKRRREESGSQSNFVKNKMRKRREEGLLGETKKLWEELRRKDLKMEARRDCCSALLALCRGKMMEVGSLWHLVVISG